MKIEIDFKARIDPKRIGLLNTHTLESCWYHNEKNIAYINIPKNASSWAKVFFESYGWYNTTLRELPQQPDKFIIILRNPIDRWISGVVEFIHSNHITLNNEVFKTISSIFKLDIHTSHQIDFLNNLDTDNCIFLKFDNTLEKNLSHLIVDLGFDLIDNNIPKLNSIDLDFEKQYIRKQLTDLIDSSVQATLIKYFYFEDYSLWKNIKFYNYDHCQTSN